jgi:hypothetical protein
MLSMPIRLVAVAAILLVPDVAPAFAQPAATRSVALDYTLTMFAIPFGHLFYSGRFESDRYAAEMHFQTSGLAAMLWKSRIDSAAQGRATPAALLPDVYTTDSLSRRGTRQSVRVEYAGRTVPVMTAVPPYDLSRNPVSDVQKKGAVDPLTGISFIVAGLSTSAGQPCGKNLAVFDGRRRYDVVFSFLRNEAAAGTNARAARVCQAEYRQISGIPEDVVAVSKVPAIYAKFIDMSGGNGNYTIAQTIWSSFLWGAVAATLTELRVDGRPVAIDR